MPGAAMEVWLGQVWSLTPVFFCDPDEPWWSETPVFDPTGYTERVVLILERAEDGALSGRIRVGDDAPPESPGNEPYSTRDGYSYWFCSLDHPTKGVEYQLRAITRTSDRLMFDVSVTEVWDAYCRAKNEPCPDNPWGSGTCPAEPRTNPPYVPVCNCTGGECRAVERGHFMFDLAITADAIEGELPLGSGVSTHPQLRLMRVR